ncbi:MAG: hypothetical protein ACRC92_26260 [Peptostreptococcaceae bacterium]
MARLKRTDVDNFRRHHPNTMEVTDPQVFINGNTPNPKGLLSPEIFGTTPKEKRTRFGYIDLKGMYLHPLVYERVLKRSYRDIDKLIMGSSEFYIDKGGELIEWNGVDELPKGTVKGTGIKFLYDNFTSIKITNIEEKEEDAEILKMVKKVYTTGDKSTLFTNKWIVYPLMFRDINITDDGHVALDEINYAYQQLIVYTSTLANNSGNMMFNSHVMEFKVQAQIVNIYKMFFGMIFGKNGQQRSSNMSKTNDYGSRNIITSPRFTNKYFGESPINIDTIGYPLSSTLNMYQPIIIFELENVLKTLFEKGRMVTDKGEMITQGDFDELFNPEALVDLMDKYVVSWGERMDGICINPESKNKSYVQIEYKLEGDEEPKYKKLTLLELMYIATYNCTEAEGRMGITARYPIQDQFGIIGAKFHVLSVDKTLPCEIEGIWKLPYYPDVFSIEQKLSSIRDSYSDKDDLALLDGLNEEEQYVSAVFSETMVLSNLLIDGFGADYDGDKMVNRGIFTDEAWAECREKLDNPMYIFDIAGKNKRNLGKDPIQAMYSLSFKASDKYVGEALVKEICDMVRRDVHKEYIFNRLKIADTEKFKKENSVYDKVRIKKGWLPNVDKDIETTLGRLLINKIIVGIIDNQPFINKPFDKKTINTFLNETANKVFDKEIDIKVYKHLLNVYEDFSFFMVPFICPSFTDNMLVLDEKIKRKKKELQITHAEGIAKGDVFTGIAIEKELIQMVKETYKDDPQMQLYDSGAKSSLGNEYKKTMLMGGVIPKGVGTSEFAISMSSLNEGFEKDELHIYADYCRIAGYFRARNPQIGGYIAKQMLSLFQTAYLDKKGTDCGSKHYTVEKVTEKNIEEYIDRYFLSSSGKLVLVTPMNAKSLYGKEVKFRTPAECKTESICNMCAGEKLYKLTDSGDKQKVPVGLLFHKGGTELTQKSLKKVHKMVSESMTIDNLDDFIYHG